MSKLFIGKVKVDDQVTEFDMSELAQGKLTLPTGAVKNLSEISDAVLLGTGNAPQEGGSKLVQEKHMVDEVNRALAAEGALQTAVTAEETARIAGDSALSGALASEISRATGEEVRIEGKHDAYVVSNDAALAAEEAARIAGDATLQGNINTLSGAVAADFSAMETDFTAAIAAVQADVNLNEADADAAIAVERARIDAMLSGSSVDFDTLKEIVDAYQLADTDIVSAITSLSGALVQEIADRGADVDAEETRALAAEALLQQNITNEETARIAADSAATTDRAAIRSEFAAADSAEATARAAADGVLQANIDAEAATRLAKDNDLQVELDATQAGAGLAIDGAYAAPASNYISAATSLMDADKKLDAAIKVNADGLAAEITNRVNGDATLQGNINALSGAVAADFSSLSTDFQAEIARVEAESDAAELALSGALDAEIARATAAEGVLQGNIDAEETARIAGDATLQGNIDALSGAVAADFASVEADMTAALAALQADVDLNEADADAAIAAEQARAEGVEAALSGALAQEIADRTAAVSAEETARIAGDAGLQAQINDILSNTDPAALDSLSEIVAAFQSADSDLNDAITAALGTHTSELNAFSGAVASDFAAMDAAYKAADLAIDTAYKAADVVLQGNIDAEETARIAGDAALQTAVDDEEARALAAEAVLAASISTEEAARIAGDATLQGNINTLSGAVAADFAAMESDFLAEIARVETESDAAEATLTANLAAEVTRAQGEEARIEGKFDNHFDGFVKVAYLTEVDTVMGPATHYIVNASAPKAFEIPVMTEDYFIMVKVAEGSSAVTLNAAVGESIDGEADGSVVMAGGTSAMFVKKGGVMYLF